MRLLLAERLAKSIREAMVMTNSIVDFIQSGNVPAPAPEEGTQVVRPASRRLSA